MPIRTLLRPIVDATAAMTGLDQRITRSTVGVGRVERCHFTDACALLYTDYELLRLEKLVLHDATPDISISNRWLGITIQGNRHLKD